MKDQSSEGRVREMRDVGGVSLRYDGLSVLKRLAEPGGLSVVTWTELDDLVTELSGYGIHTLSDDPDVHHVFWLLRDGEFYRVPRDDARLFALSLLDSPPFSR